ncbi:MAG TPA: A/G-specific adenine glycosylase [Candidatus Dormibacteraeota bacterium]|nr:A/G-specific adenine glycosylase [Candidatus Dormibacteraeota bacterium]
MWTDALPRWYAEHGRHELPWRATRDPWAVLVSEVMLQQTQVSRVRPKWEAFIDRWPTAESCAADDLAEVLRLWQGLGYPRRAAALHRCAQVVAANGWPRDEAGLRRLPGVGSYTARALMTLALARPCQPPLDVNIRRVGARAGLGVEPARAGTVVVEAALAGARPRRMSRRDYTLALFDAGALHCRSAPRCDSCPLAADCAWRRAQRAPERATPRKQPLYQGSFRQMRGAVLNAWLSDPGADEGALARAAAAALGSAPEAEPFELALRSLVADGLIPSKRAASPAR